MPLHADMYQTLRRVLQVFLNAERLAAGFDQGALDSAAHLGFSNGIFEDAPDEAAEIVEEFYPQTKTETSLG